MERVGLWGARTLGYSCAKGLDTSASHVHNPVSACTYVGSMYNVHHLMNGFKSF